MLSHVLSILEQFKLSLLCIEILPQILSFNDIFSSGAARFERSENRASSSERSEDERSEMSHSKTSIRFF